MSVKRFWRVRVGNDGDVMLQVWERWSTLRGMSGDARADNHLLTVWHYVDWAEFFASSEADLAERKGPVD